MKTPKNPAADWVLSSWPPRVFWMVVFAAAFGYVEAAVVVDLRAVYDPLRQALYPEVPPESLLPMVTLEQLRAAGGMHLRQLVIEVGREFATLVMLASSAFLATRRRGEWIAFFLITFGVWDIAYYIGLRGMIGFPESLLTWDILFLIPVPWLGPFLAPVIVAATMIASGLVVLWEIGRGRLPRGRWYHWLLIYAGALIIVVSFCKDYPQTLAGRMPERYCWSLFWLGEGLGAGAFIHALIQSRKERNAG